MKVSAGGDAPRSNCLPCKPRSSGIADGTGRPDCLPSTAWERDKQCLGSCESARRFSRPGIRDRAGGPRWRRVLFGELQPSGRLPSPSIGDHPICRLLRTTPMANRTYRFFTGQRCSRSDMDSATPNSIMHRQAGPGDFAASGVVTVSLELTNAGGRDGDDGRAGL